MQIEQLRTVTCPYMPGPLGVEGPARDESYHFRVAREMARHAIDKLSAAIRKIRQDARAETELRRLPPHLLKDVGLSRNGHQGWVHDPAAWRRCS